MQVLASKKSYALVYGVIGLAHFAMSSYMTGILSTIEKRFKMPSQTAGMMKEYVKLCYMYTKNIIATLKKIITTGMKFSHLDIRKSKGNLKEGKNYHVLFYHGYVILNIKKNLKISLK